MNDFTQDQIIYGNKTFLGNVTMKRLSVLRIHVNDENNNTSSSLSGTNNFLTHSEIQDCITNGNKIFEKEYLGMSVLKRKLGFLLN